jgi:predicted Zn finger-like uncharacterized protein
MYVTLCPECDTSFKVSDEQLAQANGWVRCGRCGAVFDGLLQIKKAQAMAEEAGLPAVAESSSAQTAEVPHVSDSPFGVAQAELPPESHRTLWVVLAAGLALLLVCQFLLLQRERLAAEEPALKPFLTALCVPFRCQVDWPSDPDYVKIENSSFNEATGGYVLQARIKSTQLYSVAMPSLELTLTDYQDQVVIRKVFSPEQMSLDDHLGAMRDAKVTLNFSIDPELKSRVSGYRAVIFYP